MKNSLQVLLLSLLLLAAPARAAIIHFGAEFNNGLSRADGVNLANGARVRIGHFRNPQTGAALTPAQIRALAGTAGALESAFVEVAATSIGVGVDIEFVKAAHFTAVAIADTAAPGVAGKQIALWIFNAATTGAATQQAILFWDIADTTTNPDNTLLPPGVRWAFPSGLGVTSIDLTDLTTGTETLAAGARVVIGSFPNGISEASDASNFGLATITITAPAGLAISTNATLPGGTAGAAYSQSLLATGGTAPLGWVLESGALPDGVSLSPAGVISGTPNAAGDFSFTAKVIDALNVNLSRIFTLHIDEQTGGSGGEVIQNILAQVGGNIPDEGGTSAAGAVPIPLGAVWGDVGQPAINDAGHVAFSGKWRAGKARSAGVFRDARLIVAAGDAVPDASGAVFLAFYDPLIGPDGSVAFLAILKGPGVTGANKYALCVFSATGTGKVIARTGETAPDTDGALFAKIGDMAFIGSAGAPRIYFTATLRKGAAALPSGTASGLWLADPATLQTPRLAIRSGSALAGFAFGENIRSISLFLPLAGSTGHGRGATMGGGANIVATLSTKRQALLHYDGATASINALGGGEVGGAQIPTAQWKSFRLPSSADDGSVMAFYGTLAPNIAGVSTKNSAGIFLGDATGFEPLARPGQIAEPIGTATFVSFLNPVLSPDGDALAFLAKIRGLGVTGANDQVLWLADSSGDLEVLAREGNPAPDGGTWKAFTNLAFPGGSRGPLFTAALKAGGTITAKNDTGVWAVDSQGTLRRLFGEGDLIGGETLKKFTLLQATPGSKGVTRSYNATGVVAYRAVFKKGAAILTATIP